MTFDLYTQVLVSGFILSIIFGAVANRSHFCTMGAVSDWVNFGDLNRLRAWIMAIGISIFGIGILEYQELVDMTLTTSNDTSNPPYRVQNFVWLRHLIGGFLFGIGMTLSSGCGNKTLVRLGEGNMKSLVVLVVMSLAASLMLFTSFDHNLFLQWMLPLSVDFSDYGINSQDLGSVIIGLADLDLSRFNLFVPPLLVSLIIFIWVLLAADFRANHELLVAAVVIGMLVVIAWYVTAGSIGQALLEELDFMDDRPYAAGAQSFSYIAPTAHTAQYIFQGFSPAFLSFGVVTVVGVIFGSFLYTIIFRKIRIEWFVTWRDFLSHIVGAALMGTGGVLAMGCTIGQGISGMATLALGSFVTIVAIIAGSAATMKFQFYLMMREDE